jgi:hypothetical protein
MGETETWERRSWAVIPFRVSFIDQRDDAGLLVAIASHAIRVVGAFVECVAAADMAARFPVARGVNERPACGGARPSVSALQARLAHSVSA